jgi:hypothetical protein
LRNLRPRSGRESAKFGKGAADRRSDDHHGEVARVAAELNVHPQTVRYGVKRLRERFGAALDDPAARFELALALRGSVLRPGKEGKSEVTEQGGKT